MTLTVLCDLTPCTQQQYTQSISGPSQYASRAVSHNKLFNFKVKLKVTHKVYCAVILQERGKGGKIPGVGGWLLGWHNGHIRVTLPSSSLCVMTNYKIPGMRTSRVD